MNFSLSKFSTPHRSLHPALRLWLPLLAFAVQTEACLAQCSSCPDSPKSVKIEIKSYKWEGTEGTLQGANTPIPLDSSGKGEEQASQKPDKYETADTYTLTCDPGSAANGNADYNVGGIFCPKGGSCETSKFKLWYYTTTIDPEGNSTLGDKTLMDDKHWPGASEKREKWSSADGTIDSSDPPMVHTPNDGPIHEKDSPKITTTTCTFWFESTDAGAPAIPGVDPTDLGTDASGNSPGGVNPPTSNPDGTTTPPTQVDSPASFSASVSLGASSTSPYSGSVRSNASLGGAESIASFSLPASLNNSTFIATSTYTGPAADGSYVWRIRTPNGLSEFSKTTSTSDTLTIKFFEPGTYPATLGLPFAPTDPAAYASKMEIQKLTGARTFATTGFDGGYRVKNWRRVNNQLVLTKDAEYFTLNSIQLSGVTGLNIIATAVMEHAEGGASRVTYTHSTRDGSERTVIELQSQVESGPNTCSSPNLRKIETVYHYFGWGESPVQKTVWASDADSPEVTTYFYYTNALQPVSYGSLQLVKSPHGAWTGYSFSGVYKDRTEIIYSPWNDGPGAPTPTPNAGQGAYAFTTDWSAVTPTCKVQTTVYENSQIHEQSTKIGGVMLYDTIHVYTADVAAGTETELVKEYRDANHFYATLTVRKAFKLGDPLSEHLLLEAQLAEDETASGPNDISRTVYTYTFDNDFGGGPVGSTTSSSGTPPPGSGVSVLITTTTANPHLPNYVSTDSYTLLADDTLFQEKKYLHPAGQPGSFVPPVIETKIFTHDAKGNLTSTKINEVNVPSPIPVSTFSANGDLRTDETVDETGRHTLTTVDKFGRTISVVAVGLPASANLSLDGHPISAAAQGNVTTTYSYTPISAGGTTITASLTAPGHATTTTEIRDRKRRTRSFTDTLGQITTTSLADSPVTGALIETKTEPNAAGDNTIATTTSYYVDGRFKSKTGGTERSEFSKDSVTAPYRLAHLEAPTSPLEISAELVTTVENAIGQELSVAKRLANPNQIYTLPKKYNNRQQLISEARVNSAGTLYYLVRNYPAPGSNFTSGVTTHEDGSNVTVRRQRTVAWETGADGFWWERRRDVYLDVAGAIPDDAMVGLGPFHMHATGLSLTAVGKTVHDQKITTQEHYEAGFESRDITTRSDSNRQSAVVSWGNQPIAEIFSTHMGLATYTYDSLGNLVSRTDPRTGLASTRAYNTLGLLASERHAGNAGATPDATYNYYLAIGNSSKLGKIKSVTNALNQAAYYDYLDVMSGGTSPSYGGSITRQWGGSVYPMETVTDLSGRTVELRTFAAATGNFAGTSWPGGTPAVTGWHYDDDFTDLLVSKSYPMAQPGTSGSQSVHYDYYPNGRLHHRIWQSGRTTTYSYSEFDQLASVTYDAASKCAPVTYTYDSATGRVRTCKDAAGLHTYTFSDSLTAGQFQTEEITGDNDSLNLLAGTSFRKDFDAQYRRRRFESSFQGQDGPYTDYYYSTVGRLSRIAAHGRSVDFAYVPQSNLLERRDFKVGLGDTGTRVLASSQLYDGRGNLTDVINQRQAPFNTALLANHYAVDGLNRRTSATREDGTHWEYGYDNRSQVTSGKKYLGSAPLAGMQQEYTYDNLGNRLTSKEGGKADGTGLRLTSYAANSLNQYSGITRTNRKNDFVGTAGTSDSVSVNGVAAERQGPWWHAEVTPDTSSPFAFASVYINGAPFATGTPPEGTPPPSGSGPYVLPLVANAPPTYASPTYDADGNLLSDNRISYAWDGENRLIETWSPSVNGNVHITYAYDAGSRRISKAVGLFPTNTGDSSEVPLYEERYLYDGWNLASILRLPAGGSGFICAQSFIWGPDVSGTLQGAGGVGGLLMMIDSFMTGQTHFPAYDGNGNVMALLRAEIGTSATVDAGYEYDPFGRTLRATGSAAEGNPFRFSTKFTDGETGLSYYGHRYYNPNLGRWISRDPSGEGGGHLYAAFFNSPASIIDVLGEWNYHIDPDFNAQESHRIQKALNNTKEGFEKAKRDIDGLLKNIECLSSSDQKKRDKLIDGSLLYAMCEKGNHCGKCWNQLRDELVKTSRRLDKAAKQFSSSDDLDIVKGGPDKDTIGETRDENLFDDATYTLYDGAFKDDDTLNKNAAHEMSHLAIDSPLTKTEHGPNPSDNAFLYERLRNGLSGSLEFGLMKEKCDSAPDADLKAAYPAFWRDLGK